jgi:actin-related protein 10
LLKAIERTYASSSVATTISFSIPSLSLPPPITGVGRGWIQIPGWIRERAAEVLFEESEGIDQRSVTESILESLLQVSGDIPAVYDCH